MTAPPSCARSRRAAALAILVAAAVAACSRDSAPGPGAAFPLYDGATLDAAATDAANALAANAGQANKVSHIFMTPDPYDAVAGFYLAKGAEAQVPPLPEAARRLPDGSEIRRTVVILDGAANLPGSNLWVVVQRPYVGAAREADGKVVFDDVRDRTSIAVVERQ
jgi:hypothetical protein